MVAINILVAILVIIAYKIMARSRKMQLRDNRKFTRMYNKYVKYFSQSSKCEGRDAVE
jgi:hypothetical protein